MTVKGVLIVDDHPVFREGLAMLINNEADLQVVAEAAGAKDAIRLFRLRKPAAVVVDLSLVEGSGLHLIKSIRRRSEFTKILVASMHDDMVYAERTMRAGANGYINKEQAASRIIHALQEVLAGRVYLDPSVADSILQRRMRTGGRRYEECPEDLLSNRELEVFELLGQGLSSRQIAEQLCLSHKTVDSHRERIKKKLGVENSFALIQRAVAWALAETETREEE